jgi:hypothetical protein
VFFIARRAAPALRGDRSMRNFVIAALLVVGVQVVASYVYPATILIQAQIMRAGVFVMIFAYIYFAHYLAVRYPSAATRGADFALLSGAMVFSPSPIVLPVVWALVCWVRPARLGRAIAAVLLPASFVATVVVFYQAQIWRPDIQIFPRRTAWTETQLWARDHTPADAVFITPPQLWWFYDPEWRVLSERSTVVTLSELLEIAFDPSYAPRWRERFAVLAPGVEGQLRGDALENNRLTAEAFYRLSSDDLLRAGQRYGASYLVMEKPNTRDFPVVYENEGFVVYRLYQPQASAPKERKY